MIVDKLRIRAFEVVLMGLMLFSLLTIPVSLTSSNSKVTFFSSGRIGLDWLHTDGRWIVDSEGNAVILRGANFMGYEFGAWDSHTEEDYAKMASWGFNVVRLPIAWHYIEPQPGTYNSSYLETYINKDVLWAKKYGIYIILDMHQYRWSPHFTYFMDGRTGNGLPSWLISAYPDTSDGFKQAITDFWLGKGPNATAATNTNPSMQDRFISMWRYVASRFANESSILAFDIFNEPNPGVLSEEEHAEYLYPFYERLISEIRKLDPTHMILYQPTFGSVTWYAKPLNYSNVAFTYPFYRMRFNYDGNKTLLRSEFNKYFDPVSGWNIPKFIGEFNTRSDYPNATLWIQDVLSLFEEHQLGWAWWTYYKSDYRKAALCYSNGTERVELTQYLKI